MLNDNAKAWIAALRSGEYKQGKGHLRNADDTYCCLGVACDVYIKQVGDLQWTEPSHGVSYYSIDGDTAGLPSKVMDWLALTSILGERWITREGGEQEYAGKALFVLNDNNDGWTFDQIAGLIESEPEGLFRG